MTKCPSDRVKNGESEKLFMDNFGLVVSQATSFKPHSRDELQEFIQAGSVGMLKAIKRFKPNKATFATYCIICIRKAIELFIKKQKKYKEFHTLEADVAYNNSESLEEYLPDCIGDIENRLLQMRIEGHTNNQIAKKTGINKNMVRDIMNKIYEKIREVNE